MIDENGEEHNIYFSGIAGEKCTYKMRKDIIEEKIGPDVKNYDKYFDMPEEYKKYL